MQRRVYGVRHHGVRRIIWHCCNPDPNLRTTRLETEMDVWGQEWTHNTLTHRDIRSLSP